MTKAEFVNIIAEKGGYSKKDAEKALAAVTGAITDTLVAGDKITLVGFGTFEVRERKAKTGINPLTKASINIPAKKVPAFKAGSALKSAIDK